jgi:hypothetical protein
MTIGPTPREKRVHFAAKVNENGDVSALCSPTPRPINLRRSTWTLREEAVDCPLCRAMLAQRKKLAPLLTPPRHGQPDSK